MIANLLLVEDEPLVAFDNEHSLAESGYHIVGTYDRVAEAVAVINAGTPIDLVLADLSLADGSGIDVAQAAFDRGIAVLFATGDCPANGRAIANGCLSKPYTQRDLMMAIAAIDSVLCGVQPKRLPSGFSLFKNAPEAA